MKILIIGSKGFIGQHCTNYFSKLGNDIYGADIVALDETNYFQLESTNTDFNFIFENHQFDVCINCSGSANVGFSFENPAIDFELNVLNVQKIVVAIRNYNSSCKFINFSSAAVYGNPEVLPIVENADVKPLSPYGFHKLQSELLLTEYHNFFGLKTCSLRVFSAYGPGLKKQLFWDLFQKANANDTITLFGTGTETRDFIYIDDLVQIIDLVIQKSDFQGTIYNVASNIETSISEAVTVFRDAIASEKKIHFNGEAKLGDPKNWCADISKIKALGFENKISINEGIKKYVLWTKELK